MFSKATTSTVPLHVENDACGMNLPQEYGLVNWQFVQMEPYIAKRSLRDFFRTSRVNLVLVSKVESQVQFRSPLMAFIARSLARLLRVSSKNRRKECVRWVTAGIVIPSI